MIWVCVGSQIYWAKNVDHGAAREEDKRETTVKARGCYEGGLV